MKKRIRILSLLCAVSASIGMLTACQPAPSGTQTPSSSTTAGSSSADSSTTPTNDAAPTLVWWAIGQQPEDLAEGIKAINAELVSKGGANIDLKISNWGDWDTKMNTIITAGEAFDIMFTNNTKYSSQVNMGALADITDLTQSEAPDLWKFIPEDVWDGTKIGGRIYAVPTYKDSSATQYFVMDDQYVQKYNIDMASLKTLADLDKPFHDMKAGEGASFYPLQLSQGSLFQCMFWEIDGLTAGLTPLGVRIDDTSRKVISVLEDPSIYANLELLHKWYMDGIVNPDSPTMAEPPKMLPFFAGQGFPGAEAGWQVTNGVAKYDMTQVSGPTYTTEGIQGSLNVISANSQYKAEALKTLQLVNTDHKIRDMFAYGMEGKHFQYDSENVVTKLTDTWTLPAYSQATFFTMSTTADSPADQWDQVRMLNEKATASSCLGFALDITNIQNEMANCKTVWDKFKYELMTGASDPAVAVPQCLKELKASGFDTVMQEAQKQIDAYFK